MPSCGTGLGNFPAPGDPNLDSPILSAVTHNGGILVSWTYPTINPEAVAHTLLYRNTVNNFDTAWIPIVVTGTQYFDLSDVVVGTTYFYWIQIVSVHGTVGNVIGPVSTTMMPPADQIMALLLGQVLNSHLHADLKTRIDEIDNFAADLVGEETLRVGGDGALGILLEATDAQLNAVDVLLASEITTRITEDSALVLQIDGIAAIADGNTAALVIEQTVRADADSALTELITTLAATVDINTDGIVDNAAVIVVNYNAQVGVNSAQATINFNISAAVDLNTDGIVDNAAAIVIEHNAWVNGDTAVASTVTALSAIVGGNTAAIEITAEVVSGPGGLSAQWMVKTDVNGYLAGFGLYNTGATSEFIINADLFAVGLAGESDAYPFIIGIVEGVPAIVLNATTVIGDATIKSLQVDDLFSTTWNPTTKEGWYISKNGNISASSIVIYDAGGNIIMNAGGLSNQALIAGNPISAHVNSNTDWNDIEGTTDAPESNADVTYTHTAANVIDQKPFATLDQITVANISSYMADLAVDTLYIANNAVTASGFAEWIGGGATISLTENNVGIGQRVLFHINALVPEGGTQPPSYDLKIITYQNGGGATSKVLWIYSYGLDSVTVQRVSTAAAASIKCEVFCYNHGTSTYVTGGPNTIQITSFSGKK